MQVDHISLPTTSNVRNVSKGRKVLAMKDGAPHIVDSKRVSVSLVSTFIPLQLVMCQGAFIR